jgi:hypothetical protein
MRKRWRKPEPSLYALRRNVLVTAVVLGIASVAVVSFIVVAAVVLR